MKRRNLFVIVGLAAALGMAGDASAERLYGNYRGPEDAKASDQAQNETTTTDATGEVETSGPAAGDSGSGGGGIGEGGGSEGGSEGGGEGGGETGAPEGGGEGGAESGSDLSGGGGTTPGAGAGTAETGGTGGGGIGGGGGGGVGPGSGKKANNINEKFELASWFFEHNREEFLFGVASARKNRVRIPDGVAAAVFTKAPRDERVLTPVSPEDRDRVFDILKSATIDKDSVVRDAAVIALGKLGSAPAVEVLLERLRLESNKAVKQDTLIALGLTRSADAVDPLIGAVKDRNLTEFALLGLGLSGDQEKAAPAVLEYFESGHGRTKRSPESLACAAMALGALRHAPAVDALVAVLKDKHADVKVQVYACQALGHIGGDDAKKALLKAMDAKDLHTRRAAVLALGNFIDTKVLAALAGKDGVRNNADPLLAGFAAVSAASILRELPESEWKKVPDEIRDAAQAHAKSKIKAQYANVALAMFGGIDNDVRRYYAEELDKAAMDADTLSSMAMAAGVAGEQSVAATLEEIANSTGRDEKLASYAAMAVGMLGGGRERARFLRQVYKQVDRDDVRRGAVSGLGMVGDRADVPFLIGVLSETDDKWLGRFTRGAAVVALGMIGDGQSIQKLQGLLKNSDANTRAYAVSALGYLADKDPQPQLPKLFGRNNFRVEFDAVKAVMGQL